MAFFIWRVFCGLKKNFVVQVLDPEFSVFFADPSLVLPALVCFICAIDGTMRSAASNAFIQVLRLNNNKFEVIRVVLDSLRYFRMQTGKSWLVIIKLVKPMLKLYSAR